MPGPLEGAAFGTFFASIFTVCVIGHRMAFLVWSYRPATWIIAGLPAFRDSLANNHQVRPSRGIWGNQSCLFTQKGDRNVSERLIA